MNKIQHNITTESKHEHGVLRSYITGFALSLIATLVPYYLVSQQAASKDTMLTLILWFAALQLVVQVVFFLHLGREKKPRWNLFFLISTVTIALLVVIASMWIMKHLHYNMSPIDVTNKVANDEAVHQIGSVQAGTCSGETGKNYTIELKGNKATPRHTDARLCDTILFVNLDDETRDIEFGVHDLHTMYAGEGGKSIRPGRNMSLRLTELGTFKFHDHIQDAISGTFTVKP
jgi:cytochrome o ubiquinol oxidase operon protein cyoD